MTPIRPRLNMHQPVFYTAHHLIIRKIDQAGGRWADGAADIGVLKGKKAVAFAGLADNAQFFDSLELAGCMLVHTFSFADHHRYGRNDLDRICATAENKEADIVVTTAKDFVKIETFKPLSVALVVVDVSIRLTGDEDRLIDTLSARLIPLKQSRF